MQGRRRKISISRRRSSFHLTVGAIRESSVRGPGIRDQPGRGRHHLPAALTSHIRQGGARMVSTCTAEHPAQGELAQRLCGGCVASPVSSLKHARLRCHLARCWKPLCFRFAWFDSLSSRTFRGSWTAARFQSHSFPCWTWLQIFSFGFNFL